VLVRGDHQLNETKLTNHCGSAVRQANAEEIRESIGPVGFIGPVGAGVPVLMDEAITGAGLVCGANKQDAHLIGVEPGRDFEFEPCDVRAVVAGDTTPEGEPVEIVTAIEVGNIFKLGTRYSVPLGATYLDENGSEQPIVMGSYGIGPARIVAAAVEQGADEKGIAWPLAIAPWQVHIVQLGKGGDEAGAAADAAYEELREAGVEVLLDDRPNAGTGEKLTDAELLGCPLRLVIGKRGVAEGVAESQERVSGAEDKLPLGELVPRVREILDRIGSAGR
jgi:prolyl-tRNA synthetase